MSLKHCLPKTAKKIKEKQTIIRHSQKFVANSVLRREITKKIHFTCSINIVVLHMTAHMNWLKVNQLVLLNSLLCNNYTYSAESAIPINAIKLHSTACASDSALTDHTHVTNVFIVLYSITFGITILVFFSRGSFFFTTGSDKYSQENLMDWTGFLKGQECLPVAWRHCQSTERNS